jgi:hypothetical protein
MNRHILSVLAFVVASFAVQATSHFAINTRHYAAVTFMRSEPIFPLGVLSMLLEGAVLSYIYSLIPRSQNWLADGLRFGWLVAVFAAGYAALADAAKYQVPAIGSWILVESLSTFIQYTIFGVLLGFIQRKAVTSPAPIAASSGNA